MHRSEANKSIMKVLIIGLILPACVLVGMFGGWIIGKNFGTIGKFALALVGGIGGLILGSLILVKLLLRRETQIES
ncbi:MAG: hypothetical protein NDF55_05460 [archaeon GB-1867-005]|nr:hypothetical protein [Candidatus Culexmicrobium cathedralense]